MRTCVLCNIQATRPRACACIFHKTLGLMLYLLLPSDLPMLHVLNPENLVTKAVGIYLSEKRLLESQLSTGSMETEQPTTPLSVEAFTMPSDPPPSAEPSLEETNEEGCPRLGSEINLSESLVSQVNTQ